MPLPCFTVVDLTPSSSGLATSINKDGWVCGFEAGQQAFIFVPHQNNSANGSIVRLVPPLGMNAQAFGINNRVDVVGSSGAQSLPGIEIAFLWRNCGIGGASSQVLNSLIPLVGSSRANAINDSRIIVGWSSSLTASRRAVLWDGHTINQLDALDPNLDSEALAINDTGKIVGSAQTRNAAGEVEEHAVEWDVNSFQITRDFGTFANLVPVNFLDLKAQATGINDSGTIIGVTDIANPPIRPRTGFMVPTGGAAQVLPMIPSPIAGAFGISPNGTVAVTTAILDSIGQVIRDSAGDIVNHGATFTQTQGLFDIDTVTCGAAPGGHGLSGGWLLNEARGVNDFGQVCGRGSSPLVQNHALLLVP